MYAYILFLVVAFVLWVLAVQHYRDKAYANPHDKKAASRARLVVLSFFLLPVYPALAIIVVIGSIIKDFRQLGRLDKEES
jgi:uncharacterized BrkB/YihY/UPF0761 family membrane protein